MKVIVNGAQGRMGKELLSSIASGYCGAELVAAVDITMPEVDAPAYSSLADVEEQADILIDFSHHSATDKVLAFALERKMPTVIATTGQTDEEKAAIEVASRKIPLFYSGNMSIGIALLVSLVKATIQVFPDADVEIVETHHNQKLDVPSGTALMIAKGIEDVRQNTTLCIGRHENGKRTAKEIGIHSLRLGNEVGTHEIIIATGAETITLKHEAENRSLFANGALAAAKFLEGKPAGLYSMQDII